MDLFGLLRRDQKFSANLIQEFQQLYGPMFFKSIELLENDGNRITKHRFLPSGLEVWVILGSGKEYILYPNLYCQCKSFTMETIYRKRTYFPCKHLLAQKFASILGRYDTETHKDREWSGFMKKRFIVPHN